MALPLRTKDNLQQKLATLTSKLRSHPMGATMAMPEHTNKLPTDQDGPVRRRSPRPAGAALGGAPGAGGKRGRGNNPNGDADADD